MAVYIPCLVFGSFPEASFGRGGIVTEGPKGKRGFVDAREEPQPKARKPTSAARKRKQEEVEPPGISSSSSSSSSDSSSDDEPAQPGQSSQANIALNDHVVDDSDWRVCNEANIDDAEEAAQGAFERSDFRQSTCLKLLRMTPLTSRGKREIVRNYSFGAYAHGNFSGITEATSRHKMLVMYLNSYLRARGASEGWSSIQISRDLETPPHVEIVTT